MVDLGGHTENVKEQLKFSKEAKQKNITIVPDCGMGPGMNVSMALLGMEQLEKTSEVRIWDGGLPQNPLPPWNYNLFFHINGLTNEYDGSAYFLKNKKINRVKCFENIEIINLKDFKIPFEAAVTSGGLSTMPWTFENQLDILENKTLRYPGHWEWMKAYRELGLFEENKINFRGFEIVPREFYHHLLKPKLDMGIIEDVCLMKVECIGYLNGIKTKNIIECVEYFDKDTGFSAMEKWTGWHASIVAIEIAKNKIPNGAIPIEKALSGSVFYDNSKIRNYNINFHSEEIL
jgi:lysine 6-dehydrogenase